MTVPSLKSKRIFQIVMFVACFHCVQLSAQTIDNMFLGHWFGYTVGSAAKPDSNYTRVDTFVEMIFRKDGFYNYKGYIKTDIFTPGKGHLRYKKNFRYMDGHYEIDENKLELKTGFKADENGLCTIYEFESSTNKFKQMNPYFKLWDTRSFYEYAPVENFKNTDIFFSSKRKQHTLLMVSAALGINDSIKFWTTSPDCPYDTDWPKPALLNTNTPLKKSMLDSVGNLVEDLAKIYVYNNAEQLIRYYYTPKKDKSFYYDIEYLDNASTTIKTITDSEYNSRYIFIRNEKECLIKIEWYDSDNKLVETFYWR